MKKTDADILNEVMRAFYIKTKVKFSQDLKYKNVNSINQILKGELKISENFIRRALNAYPTLNEMFLRGRSEEVIINESKAIGQKNLNTFTLNDLPYLFFQLIEKQEETNTILKEILEQQKKQG